ncbi:response regulator [Pseudarthrobacter sp. NPDC080039]|uniref:response regulator n=1 Tax=unclassified Pseudarthrobacter TaxID=2647000 RepID=UPI00344C072C
MNPDQVNGLISALSGLLSAVLWPAIVVGTAIKFGPVLVRKFVDSDSVTIKAAGIEASFQKGQVEMAAALGAAANAKRAGEDSVDAKAIAADIEEALPDAEAFARITRSAVLWVDDRPEGNLYERKALEAMGVRVELARSTSEALQQAKHRAYDLIISDMGRPGDPLAGYTLLTELRRSDSDTPYLIYTGSRTDEHAREAIERGALGSTNSPQELIRMVFHALRRPPVGR